MSRWKHTLRTSDARLQQLDGYKSHTISSSSVVFRDEQDAITHPHRIHTPTSHTHAHIAYTRTHTPTSQHTPTSHTYTPKQKLLAI
uniref:Uncharacterized protein n=1 Tax=Arion vulgaris TaxID=1028688 RepID=A0A0B7BUK5_9EUPU